MKKVLEKDYTDIISSLDMTAFDTSSFLITGATGLIGSLMTKFLLYANDKLGLKISVYALVRNIEKAKSIYSDFIDNPRLKIVKCELGKETINLDESIDYIIHAASVTNGKMMIQYPVETIETSILGTNDILRFAKEKKVKSMIYVSSMEAYGKQDLSEKVSESDLGYIDLGNVRNCYPESKRMCELMCTSYAKEYGLNVVSARLAQTFGAGVLEGESRVFAQFARCVIEKKDIVLHTKGLSEGNYIYTSDCLTALLTLLRKGVAGEAYNVNNENNHITIYNMAKMVASEIANDEIDVVIDIPEENMGYAADTKMWLSSNKMNALGFKAKVDLKESYLRLIEWIK